jgi:hypothetical protein
VRRATLAALAALAASAVPAAAQDSARADGCARALRDRRQEVPPIAAACQVLANYFVSLHTDGLYLALAAEQVSPRDVQPRTGGGAATGGTAAQGDAVPSVRPLPMAGGTVSAVGSDAGANAITAVTLNPSIFLTSSRDPRAVAGWSRFGDLTVFFPVDGLDQNDDGKVDYYGVRARLNLSGPAAGSRVLRAAGQSFAALVQQETDLADRIERALDTGPDQEGCIEALGAESLDGAAVLEACGEALEFSLDPGELRRLRRSLEQARAEADAGYLGLDLRLDVGDPTLGAVAGAAGTRLAGGLAIGRRLRKADPEAATFGVRARVGVRYVELDDAALPANQRTSFALDGGAGFEMVRPFEFQPVTVTLGVEFRAGNPPDSTLDDEFQTNFLMFRFGLDVPLTASNTVSLSVGAPLMGDVTPTLAVSANWSLLLSSVRGVDR